MNETSAMSDISSDLYEPMRDQLAKVNLESALAAIWSYSRYLESGQELPPELRSPDPFLREKLHMGQLAELAREAVMHCASVGGAPFAFNVFARALDSMRDITDRLSAAPLDANPDSIFHFLDVILQQQFPLQVKMDIPQILRYRSIFGGEAISEMMRAKLGVTYDECYFFLFALMGSLTRTPRLVSTQSYEEFNISAQRTASLFSWLSAPVEALACEMKSQHVLDANWGSRWNPLGSKPFVQHDPDNPDRMYCPVPALLWHKIGQGLAFDLYACPGFDNAFGAAFEEHVSTFAEYHLSSDKFTVAREKAFTYKRNLLDGADLMVSDASGTIVVECKTKRMNLSARQFAPGDAKKGELIKLAKAVVQLYKNIAHVQAGHTQWTVQSSRFFPVVATLEDWLLFSPTTCAKLDAFVIEELVREKMSPDVLEQSPYTIASCDELERLLLVVNESSVGSVLEGKTKLENRHTMLKGYLHQFHQKQLSATYPSAFSEKFDIFNRHLIETRFPAAYQNTAK
ncbi:hypothetical protein ACWYXO_17855 [Janthinobacterium aestuarii]